jgi:Xaa-Pro dipeptidase
MKKRDFLKLSGAAAGMAVVGACSRGEQKQASPPVLQSIVGDAVPIGVEELQARVAKAQMLMQDQGIDAIVLEPGSAMLYFSGISWWRSERLTAYWRSHTVFRRAQRARIDDLR